jgi:uncharacterized membrane protein HdeD (DUF308 family)
MTDTTTSTDAPTTPPASPGWLLTGGILVLLAGLFMLVFPVVATLSVTLFTGWVLFFAGVVGFAGAIRNRAQGGMWAGIVLGLLTAVAGLLLAFNPLSGTLTLTMVFVWWLIVDGAFGVVLSVARRGTAWGWWFASSLIGILLGVLLLNTMPLGAAFILGTFVGITMLMRGLLLVVTALELRHHASAG